LCAYNVYGVFLEDDVPISRDILVEHPGRHGIEAMIHYPIPIHIQPFYKRLRYEEVLSKLSQSLAKGSKPSGASRFK
jgi:perosamine synthetase